MLKVRSRGGQIVIPALLLFPTLFLFVYLIYETAKLSREKIRHQFAMDAAAFVEMTNYSDFLNRTAYVNGAFPMRIFEEGYSDFQQECEGKVATCPAQRYYAKQLFDNGAFPHIGGTYPDGSHSPETTLPNGVWNIEYENTRFGFKNVNPPDVNRVVAASPPDGNTAWELFPEDNADNYWHPWELATDIYKLYVQIYSLLGSVEDAQFQVLERLSSGHTFMQKSYWLNTGDPIGDAAVLSSSFNAALGVSDFKSVVHAACLRKLDYWGNQKTSGGGFAFQPFVPYKTTPDIDLTANGGAGCANSPDGPGLFQIEYLDGSMVNSSHSGTLQRGLTIQMPWSIPAKNFFNVDFVGMMAQQFPGRELHTTISLIGDPKNSVSVWPDPTPKFQVRQFP